VIPTYRDRAIGDLCSTAASGRWALASQHQTDHRLLSIERAAGVSSVSHGQFRPMWRRCQGRVGSKNSAASEACRQWRRFVPAQGLWQARLRSASCFHPLNKGELAPNRLVIAAVLSGSKQPDAVVAFWPRLGGSGPRRFDSEWKRACSAAGCPRSESEDVQKPRWG